MSRQLLHANRFVPKYCGIKLPWYDRNYGFIDLNKWEEFDKDKDFYISNVNVTSFLQIYKDIGFRPKNGSLKKTGRFSEVELKRFDENIKKCKTVDEPLVNQISDQNKRYETKGACFRTERKDIYIQRALILSHFRYLKEW